MVVIPQYSVAPRRLSLLRSFVALALAGALLVPASVAQAHTGECLTDLLYGSDPNCRGHWQDFHTQYHWNGELSQAHHSGERDRFLSAATSWQNASGAGPWHVHFDSTKPTHVSMVNFNGSVLGTGRPAREDGNDHIPQMQGAAGEGDGTTGLWLRHDIGELICQGTTACSWYTGTGTPGGAQLDAWGVWMEELGHAQNITHHLPPGHSSAHDHTMSGSTTPGTTDKRNLTSHEADHACDPYELTHSSSC